MPGMSGAVWYPGLLIISRFLAVGAEPLRHEDLMEAGHGQWSKTETSATPALSASSLSVGMLLAVSNKSQSRMTQAVGIFTIY